MRQAEKSEGRRCTCTKVRRKKTRSRQMLEQSRNAFFCNALCVGSVEKVGLLKRRVRSHVARGEIKNCTPLWARSAFGRENVTTEVSEHFLKFGCQKNARRCGEKHIMKSKCERTAGLGTLFEVLMSKNCTPLCENTFLKWKCTKHLSSEALFDVSDVKKLHAAVAKSTFWSQNAKKLRVRERFLKFWCRKNATPLWRKAHFRVKMYKILVFWCTFSNSDVEQLGR